MENIEIEKSESSGCTFNRQSSKFSLHSINEKQSLTYSSYLNLDKLLSCQTLIECGKYTHDQLLFQITHQVYELWFKQIIFEIDSIKEMFQQIVMDERNMRVIINRLNRVVLILKTLVDQISILETMTAIDFMDFRGHLQAASGFQSLQFRLLENKLGVSEVLECHSRSHELDTTSKTINPVFEKDPIAKERVENSLDEESLQVLLERWLERTPGCNDADSNFWESYCLAVRKYLKDCYEDQIAKLQEGPEKKLLTADYEKEKKSYETITDENHYNELIKRGEKRFSYNAFKGALMISLYRDETRFSQPYQMLSLILDIDAFLTKWRYNHVIMVQRMIGSKLGTGGSSGYQYLRSTVSDRYMPFCDLCNLSTYLIPREYIPKLSSEMLRRLSQMDFSYNS